MKIVVPSTLYTNFKPSNSDSNFPMNPSQQVDTAFTSPTETFRVKNGLRMLFNSRYGSSMITFVFEESSFGREMQKTTQ